MENKLKLSGEIKMTKENKKPSFLKVPSKELEDFFKQDAELNMLWSQAEAKDEEIRRLAPNEISERANRAQVKILSQELSELNQKWSSRRSLLERQFNEANDRKENEKAQQGFSNKNLYIAFFTFVFFVVLTGGQLLFTWRSFDLQKSTYLLEKSKIKDDLTNLEEEIKKFREQVGIDCSNLKSKEIEEKLQEFLNKKDKIKSKYENVK